MSRRLRYTTNSGKLQYFGTILVEKPMPIPGLSLGALVPIDGIRYNPPRSKHCRKCLGFPISSETTRIVKRKGTKNRVFVVFQEMSCFKRFFRFF
ncbi:MAG TPA: hypothetical protein DEB39_13075 [Planctomycetaceae bacterium]|nr:hypothetical protein [Planctomycetaceae bacterium]